jgi:hypothetical protein
LRFKSYLQEKGLVEDEMPLCRRKEGDDFSLLSDSKPSPYFAYEGCENIIDSLFETEIWFLPSGGNAYTLSSASLQEHIGMSYDVETNEMVFVLLFSTYYISLLRFDPTPMDKEFSGEKGFVQIIQRRMAHTLSGYKSIGNFPIDSECPPYNDEGFLSVLSIHRTWPFLFLEPSTALDSGKIDSPALRHLGTISPDGKVYR